MNIGIDVGGTNLAAGFVNEKGIVIGKISVKTNAAEGYEAVINRIAELVKALEKEKKVKNRCVGLGIPGIISRDGKSVLSCPNLKWENKPLKTDLEALTGQNIYLANDATVAGLAENNFGSTKGYKDAVMLTIGTGIGGSIILSGKGVNGAHGVASEVGHMIVGCNFYDCNCGKNGCLETFSSATALIRLAQKMIVEGQPSKIMDSAKGDFNAIDAKMVMDAAKEDDLVGKVCFNNMIEHLSIAISNITDIIDPAIYCIGGGVASAGDFLLNSLKQGVKKQMTFKKIAMPEIVLATFLNDAGIIGAASIVEYC
ncbi:MAG: ROK family protein [Eubacterium sp.]